MPTKEKYQKQKARLAAGIPAAATGKPILLGTLANLAIMPDVLDAFPDLLRKDDPDRDQPALVIERVPQPNGKPAAYRILTWGDLRDYGASYYPRTVYSLSEIRAVYVALPT